MIDFIEGTVESKAPGELVISAGGVGFLLMCSNTTLAEAPAKGEKWRCYSVLNVREDAMELFGFATRQERAMFKKLCQVTGVGAKTALGVLSALPVRDLSVAIVTGDVTALSRAPGIGKKTAQRIALELKDKVTQADINQPTGKTATPTSGAAADNFAEAIEALTALGYSAIEARDALSHVEDKDAPVDELIRLALRAMAGM